MKPQMQSVRRLFAALHQEMASGKYPLNHSFELQRKVWVTLNSAPEGSESKGRLRFDFMVWPRIDSLVDTDRYWFVVIWTNEFGEYDFAKELPWFGQPHKKLVAEMLIELTIKLLGQKFYQQIDRDFYEEMVNRRLEKVLENNGQGIIFRPEELYEDELEVLKQLPWCFKPKYQKGRNLQVKEGMVYIYANPYPLSDITSPQEILEFARLVFPTEDTPTDGELVMPPAVWYNQVRPIIKEHLTPDEDDVALAIC